METLEIENAIIKSAELIVDEYGVLSAKLYLDYASGGGLFFGHSLYMHDRGPRFSYSAGLFIHRVMEIAGVDIWSNLPGSAVRVKSSWHQVSEIGHLIADLWFNPEIEIKQIKP
jgi:hypothetical protein